MFALRSAALLLVALLGVGLAGRQGHGSGSAPPAPGAKAVVVDDGAWMWAKLGARLSFAEEEEIRKDRPTRIVWKRRTVIAVRAGGPADLAGVKPGASAVLVPQGSTGDIVISTGKSITTVFHPNEEVLHLHTVVSGPWKITVTGQKPGVARLTLTDVDGKKEEVVAVVAGKAK
jgi:hypothetical protein